MDPGVIEMLSKVDGATKTSGKGKIDVQELYAQMQEQMDIQLNQNFKPQANQQVLGDQFDSLMNADRAGSTQPSISTENSSGPSTIRMVLTEQDHLLQNAVSNIQDAKMNIAQGGLTTEQQISQYTTVIESVGTVAVNGAVHVSVEKSVKSNFDTMLKNQ